MKRSDKKRESGGALMKTSEVIRPEDQPSKGEEKSFMLPGQIERYRVEGDTVLIYGTGSNLAVRWITPKIVRLLLFHGDQPDWSQTPAIRMECDHGVRANVEETEEILRIYGGELQIDLNRSNMTFQVLSSSGDEISQPYCFRWSDAEIDCYGGLRKGERIYGLGETTGFLNKSGEKYTMWNSDVFDPHVPEIESLYQSIPFMIHFYQGSSFGLYLDNPGKSEFDMRNYENGYRIRIKTGKMDLYVIAGPSLKEVVSSYSELTGTMPMPPLWAIGYHQSRYSYKSQEEVLSVAETFRQKNIPCDAIYLDIHYMDEFKVFTFNPERFPAPEQMVEKLNELGFRVVPIVDPGIKVDENYPVYQDGIENEMFCRKPEGDHFVGPVWPGESVFPDYTNDKVRQWWGKLLAFYTGLGITGIWNDMNEPSVFNETKTMDLDVVHENDGTPKTHEEIHNLYGFMMAKATYEGLRKLLSGERPFALTRSGFAGIQRYAAVWTGDNRSYWEHLAMSVPMLLNLGLSGVPFCGADIGGFGHHANGELLARWTQLGVFTPFCRNHSMDHTLYQEPWRFGDEITSICRKYIQMRYQWMPYWYSLFYQASIDGLPVMRPLVMEYPDDPETYDISDQYLVGEYVLIAPVIRPHTKFRVVYLPEGTWYDYWSGTSYRGESYIMANAALDTLPIFIRAGAVIPTGPVVQHMKGYGFEKTQFEIYAGGSGSILYYEDDGLTEAYRNGCYNAIDMKFDWANTSLLKARIGIFPRHKGYFGGLKEFTFIVKQMQDRPSIVRFGAGVLGGEDLTWTYDPEAGQLVIRCKIEEGWIEIK